MRVAHEIWLVLCRFRVFRLARIFAASTFRLAMAPISSLWRKPVELQRVILLNSREPSKYPDNTIRNTKYTLITFLPKNLLEQFGRFMNLYFLLIACLQLWSLITPVDPASTWVPLAFIFAVSAIKEAVDDLSRARRDRVANSRPFTIYKNGMQRRVLSKDIRVGDIVLVQEGEEIPCDLALIASSEKEEGVCFLQTSNLDGESDLKPRFAPQQTRNLSPQQISELQGSLECAPPDPHIYQFHARLCLQLHPRSSRFFTRSVSGEDTPSMLGAEVHSMASVAEEPVVPLNEQQFLPQATQLRNTEWIAGVAVYTGNQTKVGMNKATPPVKWTRLDRQINRVTMCIFVCQLLLVISLGVTGNLWKRARVDETWYLRFYDPSELGGMQWVIIPLRFLLLNSMMIPISLKVTLDVAKFFYALLINWDAKMYDEESCTPAQATSTALSEDLGQIQFVLSDKTGTLTENRMVLVRCCIGDTAYGVAGEESAASPIWEDTALMTSVAREESPPIEFCVALAVGHTVETAKSIEGPNEVNYRAASPDEEALVIGAARLGVQCTLSNNQSIRVLVAGRERAWARVCVLPFSSDRRRMSVLLRDEHTRTLHLYCKGADDVMLARLAGNTHTHTNNNADSSPSSSSSSSSPSSSISSPTSAAYASGPYGGTLSHLEAFAQMGLRTLLICHRTVSEKEFADWHARLQKAQGSMLDRDAQLAALYDELEHGFTLLGATAIEDKLQPGVPQTIRLLRDAGIRVWMLTGDKPATALQIALSCAILTPGDVRERLLRLQGGEADVSEYLSKLDKRAQELAKHPQGYSLMLEGRHLNACLQHPTFAQVCVRAKSVICSRVTPQQKAQAVHLVRGQGFVTLAVGDGGNDVSMIQQADIGVGIYGREGLQASRAADYSIARFRFLQRLILIHGRHSYLRTSFLSQYSFFKSMIICWIQILYSFVSGFGGTSFFNTFALTFYNVVFTSVPPLASLLDQDHRESVLLTHAHKYNKTQHGKAFNWATVCLWVLRAVVQACLVFSLTCAFSVNWTSSHNGSPWDYQSVPMVAYTSLIGITTATVLLESSSPTWVHIWACVLTFVAYFASTLILGLMPAFSLYQIMPLETAEPAMWLCVTVTIVAALAPVYAVKSWFAPRRHFDLPEGGPTGARAGHVTAGTTSTLLDTISTEASPLLGKTK